MAGEIFAGCSRSTSSRTSALFQADQDSCPPGSVGPTPQAGAAVASHPGSFGGIAAGGALGGLPGVRLLGDPAGDRGVPRALVPSSDRVSRFLRDSWQRKSLPRREFACNRGRCATPPGGLTTAGEASTGWWA